jgi:hypothetical protein
MRMPLWVRLLAVLLVMWGLMGCYACFQQFRLGADAMGPASDYDRALFAGLPIWYNSLYAVAVGTGLLGGITLLTASILSIPLFAIALLASIAQFGWLFATTDINAVKGVWVTYFPAVIVAIQAAALLLARYARRRRWIG